MQQPLHVREAERNRLRILLAEDRRRMERVGFNGMPLQQPPQAVQLPADAAMENANRPPPPRHRAPLPIQNENYYHNILVAILLIVFFGYYISSSSQAKLALVAPVRLHNALYDLLSVSSDADSSEIKKAYMKIALKGDYRHPDKGGDPKKFQVLQQAYEILSDDARTYKSVPEQRPKKYT